MRSAKIAVVTGSAGGIGTAIADQLAADGWWLVLVNRNAEKAELQKSTLSASYPDIRIDLVQADLQETDHIKRAAGAILSRYSQIDALYNNAGVLTSKRILSAQGHESNYAVNTLAPYMFVDGLRPALRRRPEQTPTMVINTTSSAQSAAKSLDVDKLSNPEQIGGLTGAYAMTKLALTTMGAAMSSDLKEEGILLRSVCPGPVNTSMTNTSDAMPGFLKLLVPLLFKSPEKQAAKMIHAGTPDAYGGRTGIYITDGKEKQMPKPAADPQTQTKLMSKLSHDAA